MHDAIRINGERFWSTIERSGEIGVGRPGGLARLALSDADRKMRDLFVGWCREAGCTVTIDQLGSIFARREGADASLPPVVMGSHLDTQVNGGKYDGILGVLAGLEVIRALNDHDVTTRRPIELVSWTNEEGARFSPPMVASGAFAGVYEPNWVLGRLDDDNKRFGDELARIGYAGSAPVGRRALDAYFELHIEQGPILDAQGIDVGVVVKGYAVRGFLVEVRGETAHTGPTPMDQRRNALVGAAMLAVAVNDVGWRYHPSGGKATAAWLLVKPNQPGILSDWAQLIADVRHEDAAVADRMAGEVLEAVSTCAERSRCEIAVIDRWSFGNERFDPECVRLIREAAQHLGVRTLDIASQAGHDAYHVAKASPMAMIFTPCHEGVTHNNREHAEMGHSVPGVNVLLHAVLARAMR
jgi:N-carbamoyl-L-amino-acid hydrolase